MKRIALLVALTVLAGAAMAQDTSGKAAEGKPITVSVAANGTDVRSVLSDLFGQAKKNFVLATDIKFTLYLSLTDLEFEEALQLICKTSGLKYEEQNGIFFVNRDKTAKPSVAGSAPQTAAAPTAIKGTLSRLVLNKHVTTKFQKVDIRELFTNLQTQTGVKFEVATNVPAYKLDAFLNNTSLRYALENITQAAKLQYRFTDHFSIEILTVEPEKSHIAVLVPDASKG